MRARAAESVLCSRASAIQPPMTRISASFMPRVVRAGVPMRTPEGLSGGFVSVSYTHLIDDHDFETRRNQAIRFLKEGDKVKASLRFKGRQMAHRELGYAIINRLIQDIGENGIVEFMPRMEGNTLHAILAPGKKEAPKKPVAPRPQAPPQAPLAQTAQ